MLIKNYNQEKFVIRNAKTIMNHFVNFHNNFEIFVSGFRPFNTHYYPACLGCPD